MHARPFITLGVVVVGATLASCTDAARVSAPETSVMVDPGATMSARLRSGESQPALDPALRPLALYPTDVSPDVYAPNKQNLAQTFTSAETATLRVLSLPVACDTRVRLHVEVRDGGPAGAVLHASDFNPAQLIADGTFIDVPIRPAVSLTAGGTYAFVLSTTPRRRAASTTCSIIAGPSGDSYARGQGFYNNPGFPANYWVPLPDGAPTSSTDLPFAMTIR